MITDANKVFESLISRNYFFNQKKDEEDLPPCFSSDSLYRVSQSIIDQPCGRINSNVKGYDLITYKLTRHNNAPRIMNLPHPKPYLDLCNCLKNNWDKILKILRNSKNKLLPTEHEDGRIIIMNYEKPIEKEREVIALSLGKKYRVDVDISTFYQNIYTHSLPWAIEGIKKAKRGRVQGWHNELDKCLQKCQRNETHGIPIGPATSEIISDILLSKIDEILMKNFTFIRYIDDYSCYCESRNDVDEFLIQLSSNLYDYKLVINNDKTKISELPILINDKWILTLRNIISKIDVVNSQDISFLINTSLNLAQQYPDGSVLKYVIKTLCKKCSDDEDSCHLLLDYAWSLCYYFPYFIPVFSYLHTPENTQNLSKRKEVLNTYYKIPSFIGHMNNLIRINSSYQRSDIVTWLLYYSTQFQIPLKKETIDCVIKSKDCFSILMLYEYQRKNQPDDLRIQRDIKKFLKSCDLYDKDQYWILLYELFKDGNIANPYNGNKEDAKIFEIMRNAQCSFYSDSSDTEIIEEEFDPF